MNRETIELVRATANERIEEIFSQLDIDVNFSYCLSNGLRSSCPIHGGDNATAFSWRPEIGLWTCFSKDCSENYQRDIFGLVTGILEQKNGQKIKFIDSVLFLANLFKIPISEDDKKTNLVIQDSAAGDIDRLISNMRMKNTLNQKLNKDPSKMDPISVDKYQKAIVKDRWFTQFGFKEETLDHFMVGYCDKPNKPMYLRSYAPILSDDGQYVTGLTGRITLKECIYCDGFHDPNVRCKQDGGPNPHVKWMHWGFASAGVLYNSWNKDAQDEVKSTGVAVLTEGPKDCWWLWQNGIKNSFCILGTSPSLYHVKRLIDIGCRTVVSAMDNDESGRKGALRLRSTFSHYFKVIGIESLMPEGADIADISESEIETKIKPFLKKII